MLRISGLSSFDISTFQSKHIIGGLAYFLMRERIWARLALSKSKNRRISFFVEGHFFASAYQTEPTAPAYVSQGPEHWSSHA
jgi:hypothetical protein